MAIQIFEITLVDISLGVSACLLGQKVRFDGGHKFSNPVSCLGRIFHLAPICPEVGIGMPTPRPPVRLVEERGKIKLLSIENPQLDFSAEIRVFAEKSLNEIRNYAGYVFKKNSPSCGLNSIVYDRHANKIGYARGMYAKSVSDSMPLLPIVEEQQLIRRKDLNRFISKVVTYHLWQLYFQNQFVLKEFLRRDRKPHCASRKLRNVKNRKLNTESDVTKKKNGRTPPLKNYKFAVIALEYLCKRNQRRKSIALIKVFFRKKSPSRLFVPIDQ